MTKRIFFAARTEFSELVEHLVELFLGQSAIFNCIIERVIETLLEEAESGLSYFLGIVIDNCRGGRDQAFLQ